MKKRRERGEGSDDEDVKPKVKKSKGGFGRL